MKYVFDSGPIIDFKYYYRGVFSSFWDNINELVINNELVSTLEVFNELSGRGDLISEWVEENKDIFLIPDEEEIELSRQILKDHPELIKNRNIVGGKPVADPFVIALGYSKNLIVVSTEKFTPHAHKIPNICQELGIPHMNSGEFMENENWSF